MLRLILKTRPISGNVFLRMHGAKREQIKNHLWYLVQIELRKHKKKVFFRKKVDILLIGHFTSHAPDSTNLFTTLKLIEDSIKGRLIVDDSPKYVGITSCFSRIYSPQNYLELIISLHNPATIQRFTGKH